MFFTIIYKSPLFIKNGPNKRLIRVFIMGIICYIILHSFLYSDFINNNNLIKYRKYIYYLAGLDAASIFFLQDAHIKKPKKKIKYNQKKYMIPFVQNNKEIEEFKRKMELEKQKREVLQNNKFHTNEINNKNKELFITRDQVVTKSAQMHNENDIPIYKSKNIPVDIPIYNSK